MSAKGSEESEFIWYWYQLVWALEGLEEPATAKYNVDPQEMRSLFKDALARLERVMDNSLLAELRQKHRRKVAAGQWLALHKRLESFEHSPNAPTLRETVLPSNRIREVGDEKNAIQRELTLVEEELGKEEVSRVRHTEPLPLCGTAMLRASQWSAQKQQKEDKKLLEEVEVFLTGMERIH